MLVKVVPPVAGFAAIPCSGQLSTISCSPTMWYGVRPRTPFSIPQPGHPPPSLPCIPFEAPFLLIRVDKGKRELRTAPGLWAGNVIPRVFEGTIAPHRTIPPDRVQGLSHVVNILACAIQAHADADGPRYALLVAGGESLPNHGGAVIVDMHQLLHEWVRAKTSMPHTDPVFGAEDGGKMTMPEPGQIEGDNPKPRSSDVRPQTVERHPRQRGQGGPGVGCQLHLCRRHTV